MKRYIKIFCILFLLLFVFINAKGQTSYTNLNTRIEFIINTNTIIHNSEYNYYINTIIPELRNNIDNLDRILLIGSASPEGNKAVNIRLANLRADKIYSYISSFIPRNKIEINNDYNLFLSKTGLDESDYQKLRATYVEVIFKEPKKEEVKVDTLIKEHFFEKEIQKVDTVYIKDTINIEKIDTVYKEKLINNNEHDRLVFSLYNSITSDLLKTGNIGFEVYFNKMSYFLEGEFNNTTFLSKDFKHDLWTTGLRKYFNNKYNKAFIELYLRTGYYDIEFSQDNRKYGLLYGAGFGIGYKFNLCRHVKLYPFIRFGYDYLLISDYIKSDDGSGNVNVMFKDYIDYRANESNQNSSSLINNELTNTYTSNKIDSNFYNRCNKGYWIGPTYIGLLIQVDLYKLKK